MRATSTKDLVMNSISRQPQVNYSSKLCLINEGIKVWFGKTAHYYPELIKAAQKG